MTGPLEATVAYQRNSTLFCWVTCLSTDLGSWQIVAIVAFLAKDADILTLGKNLTMTASQESTEEHYSPAAGPMSEKLLHDSLSDSMAKLRLGDRHITNGPQHGHSAT